MREKRNTSEIGQKIKDRFNVKNLAPDEIIRKLQKMIENDTEIQKKIKALEFGKN